MACGAVIAAGHLAAPRALAGIADSPLPTFADGKASILVARIPGVVKRNRLQTDFLCTSLNNSPIDVGVEVFDPDGMLLNNVNAGQGAVLNVAPGQTVTIGTGATATYLETAVISLGNVSQGSARVVASSERVRCNVMLLDNLVTPPESLAMLAEGVQPAAGAAPATAPLPQFANGHQATHAMLFPGAVKRLSAETDVFCTSLASGSIDVGVEVFDAAGTIANSIPSGNGAMLSLAPGATVTFGTTGTASLLEGVVITLPAIAQGLARVVGTSDQVICNAAILDSSLAPPAMMSNLVGWGANSPASGPGLPVPLPLFADGKASLHIMTVPGMMKRGQLQTEVMCTSAASTPVDIGVQVFAGDGTLKNDISAGVGAVLDVVPGQTVTIGTSATAAFLESTVIPLGTGLQGVARIVASAPEVRCNVVVVDDSLTPPTSSATLSQGVQPVPGAVPGTVPLPQFADGNPATHALVFPGVVKRGNAETDFLCTSLASGAIDVGVEILRPDGTVANSVAAGNGAVLGVLPGNTVTIGTTGTAALFETAVISLTGIAQGLARVVSTSSQLICSAITLDAGLTPPRAMSALVGFAVAGSGATATATPTISFTPTPTISFTPTPTPVPVCGNGNIENGEQCDDGNATPGDGCGATCHLECAGVIAGAKLSVQELDTPPGDDKLLFSGTVTLPLPLSTPLDPPTNGIRVFIDGAGGAAANVAINPGAGGWISNAKLTKWINTSSTRKVLIGTSSTPGVVKFKVKASAGSYAVAPVDLPLTAFVVFAPGQCGKVDFTGLPAPSCSFNGAASRVKCR